MKPPIITQFTERGRDGDPDHMFEPRPHEDEKLARAHAKELSFRRDGIVTVMRPDMTPIATYEGGEATELLAA